MVNKKNKYELLAPVGNFPMLVTAINAGADAVYFGLGDFSMRSGSRNFQLKDLPKIKKICEEQNVNIKRYLTVNTIIYDNELSKVESLIKKVKPYVDAIICWDLSVINLCKKHKIPFFISTQASVANTEAAKFYKKLGAERVVLARELNLKQVKEISKVMPIEVFAHGAMCVSISGRCFTSQFLFNKSANRGECLHPCRRSYIVKDKQEGYELEIENNKVFSAKDLCTLPFLEKLKDAGITSFKIEGRNRDPRYLDGVIRIYRKALDSILTKSEIKESMHELKKIYNKEFSPGFYLGLPKVNDFSSTEHSSATKKKHYIGKILHYYPNVKVATMKVSSEFKLGEEIVIIGKTTGLVSSKVDRLEINHKPVKQASKGEEVGFKIDSRVRKNDEVYVVRDS